jgi:signal transduction histidine kinase
MRRLLGVLRTDPAGPLAPQPGLALLPELVSRCREAGLPVSLEVDAAARPLPPGVDLSAYRIVQEALTNTLKHAGPARATVRVRYDDEAVEVQVRDERLDRPERGGVPAPGGGNGLVGMRERVHLVGGTVTAGPVEGGWCVVARLPAPSLVRS